MTETAPDVAQDISEPEFRRAVLAALETIADLVDGIASRLTRLEDIDSTLTSIGSDVDSIAGNAAWIGQLLEGEE